MIARDLIEAIQQVREDMAKVELWACALTGCARPVPDYEPGEMAVWLPREQASVLEEASGGGEPSDLDPHRH
jgi:hypothetical protein